MPLISSTVCRQIKHCPKKRRVKEVVGENEAVGEKDVAGVKEVVRGGGVIKHP